MVRLLALVLSALLALPAVGQLQTQPTGVKKMDGSDSTGGGGSGTGFVCDADEEVCIFQAPAGYEIEINSDSTYLGTEVGNSVFGVTPTGALTYIQAQLVGTAKELRDITTRSTTGTFTGTNILCSTGGGAVVGTLDADAATNGRFVYITRSGASTCTVAVESGHTLDGVTDGTTTIANGGSKTFKQSGDTAWITTTEYPVTGTLSGLTATKIPVATSATAVGDSAITHNSTTGVTTFAGSGPTLELTEGSIYTGTGLIAIDGDSYVVVKTGGTQIGYFAGGGSDGWNGNVRASYVQAAIQTWGSSSKALVDATATAFMFVYLDTGGYDGGTVEYVIHATDGTDKQVRSGSVPFSAFDTAGTGTCSFGTASDVVHVSVGTLAVTWDCTDATNGVYLRANVDTSLASTTVFTIKSRVNTQGREAGALPQ